MAKPAALASTIASSSPTSPSGLGSTAMASIRLRRRRALNVSLKSFPWNSGEEFGGPIRQVRNIRTGALPIFANFRRTARSE